MYPLINLGHTIFLFICIWFDLLMIILHCYNPYYDVFKDRLEIQRNPNSIFDLCIH